MFDSRAGPGLEFFCFVGLGGFCFSPAILFFSRRTGGVSVRHDFDGEAIASELHPGVGLARAARKRYAPQQDLGINQLIGTSRPVCFVWQLL